MLQAERVLYLVGGFREGLIKGAFKLLEKQTRSLPPLPLSLSTLSLQSAKPMRENEASSGHLCWTVPSFLIGLHQPEAVA